MVAEILALPLDIAVTVPSSLTVATLSSLDLQCIASIGTLSSSGYMDTPIL